MNKLIKYLILLILTFPLFGQYSGNELPHTEYTFANAVDQYNFGNYEEVDIILNNLSKSEQNNFVQEIALLSMRVKYRLNDFHASKELGKYFIDKYPRSELLNDVLITLGDIFLAEGIYESAFRTYIKAFKDNNDEHYRANLAKRVFLTLQFGIPINVIDELAILESDEQLLQILALAKAHSEIQNGQKSNASISLSKLNKQSLTDVCSEYYSKLMDKVVSDIPNSSMIAVVLPLSGKNANIGKEFLKGLEFSKDLDSHNFDELSVIVFDNEGDELKTLEIFRGLSNYQNLAAVIGPMSTANSIIASSVAESLGIPLLLPNVTKNGLANISTNIFLMNSDLKTRGALAAEYIAETIEAENIAVLAPTDEYGKSLVDAFVERLELFNKTPLIIEWYSGLPTNLDRQFTSIRNKAWELSITHNSLETFEDISDSSFYEPTNKYNGRMTEDDSAEVILRTIDAIYMPIHQGHLIYIGAQYPTYNLETVVIGNDNWTNLNLLRKENIGPHFNNLIAISNYNYHQLDSLNNNYGVQYNSYFYQAIDCYNLLVNATTEAKITSKPLLQILTNINNFEGMFGTYSFKDNLNNVNSSLNIIQFDGYKFDNFFDSTYLP